MLGSAQTKWQFSIGVMDTSSQLVSVGVGNGGAGALWSRENGGGGGGVGDDDDDSTTWDQYSWELNIGIFTRKAVH
jgi:hypothetical protein